MLFADTTDERRTRYIDGIPVYQARDEKGGKWWIANYVFGVYALSPEEAIASWHDHNKTRNVVRRTVGVTDGDDPGGNASR